MDGIHDLGGMHGFGPVPYAPDDPPYHEPWEARVFAASLAARVPAYMNLDYSRHSIERIPPAVYLASSYYERWLLALIMRQLEAGHITREELAQGRAAAGAKPRTDAIPPEAIDPFGGQSFRREIPDPPRFAVGDVVRTGDPQTTGHTRLPRYARRRCGEVLRHHGAHVLPDSHAAGEGEHPTHLYTVAFSARELWGPQASAADRVHVDVWECHLEPA